MTCCRPIRKIKANPYNSRDTTLPFIVLGPNSPLSYRKAGRLLAEDFANNAHFSPTPYEANEVEDYGKYFLDRVLLFSEPINSRRIRCFGAVGIRWQKYDELPEARWIMTWAWFHPSEQRKGHLTKAWPHIL